MYTIYTRLIYRFISNMNICSSIYTFVFYVREQFVGALRHANQTRENIVANQSMVTRFTFWCYQEVHFIMSSILLPHWLFAQIYQEIDDKYLKWVLVWPIFHILYQFKNFFENFYLRLIIRIFCLLWLYILF